MDPKDSVIMRLTCISNMKALAQMLFEISCTQDFQILSSKGHNSEKRHKSDVKKYESTIFFRSYLYLKFQNLSIHCSKVSNFTQKKEFSIKIS